jgi:hypothetical protein
MVQSTGMRKAVVLAAVLAWIGGSDLMSQIPPAGPRLLATYIPITAGPWLSEADQVYDSATIFDYIDGAGEVYRSYNMRYLVARRFHKDGRPDIVVDAFDMGSPADAFGVFTHDLDGVDAGIGQGSTYKAGLLSFWKDRYFLSVYAEEETPETKALVLDLGRAIAGSIPGVGAGPGILDLLPRDGQVPGRIRFFHNHAVLNYHFFVADADILELGGTADAVLADYAEGGGTSRLFIVAYADAAASVRAGASFRRAYLPAVQGGAPVRTENGRWTAYRVIGRLVAVVFDTASRASAEARLDAVEKRAAGTTKGGTP